MSSTGKVYNGYFDPDFNEYLDPEVNGYFDLECNGYLDPEIKKDAFEQYNLYEAWKGLLKELNEDTLHNYNRCNNDIL